MTTSRFLGCLSVLILTSVCPSAFPQDNYLGAEGVLQIVRERHQHPEAKPPADERSKFVNELKTFGQTVTNLPPTEAASRWLALVDRAAKFQRQPIEVPALFAALPPPADWQALAQAIAARPPAKKNAEIHEIGLRLLAAALTDNPDGLTKELVQLDEKARNDGPEEAQLYENYLQQISLTLQQKAEDPDSALKFLRLQLNIPDNSGFRQIDMPNLVAQVGPEKAEVFLRQALVTPGIQLQFMQPNETSRLAQKLALELVDQLKLPQWRLVNSLDAVKLYEAMDRRFGQHTNSPASSAAGTSLLPGFTEDISGDGYIKALAQGYYLLGLVSQYRVDEAVTIAQKSTGQNSEAFFEQAFQSMQQAGYTVQLDDFLYKLLAQDPALPFWNEYFEIAAQAGKTDRMLALLRQAITNPDLSTDKKAALHQLLFKALLAADQVDAGVQEMRQLMSADETDSSAGSYNSGQLGVMLARIGLLMQKPEWVEAGIKAATNWLAKPVGNDSIGENENVAQTLADILCDLKRGPEAEAVLANALDITTRSGAQESSYSRSRYILKSLAMVYDQAGRPDDVLHLLTQSPNWPARDLSELFVAPNENNLVSIMWLHTGVSPVPVPYLAAKALLAKGRNAEAQKIDDVLLDKFPGLDRGYELLIALQGTNAIPKLDALFRRDQFEERPLIWKAHLLRQQNRLAEAEAVARQAVAIDPSDGEEGRGDRMRVYSELAEIRAAQGDQKEADFYRGVVQAIRLSEAADQFYQAGLLKRAIPMYEQGLQHFSDAYCIQSRLAIQLSALGLNAEAEEHYRRAYELMPDSFGRVESHCFGCERAFDGGHAQSIAEKVFTQMAAERPNKPQVHYLLGYLRGEEGRFAEARTNYLTAVHLDPEYLNAWVKLDEVDAQLVVPAQERDEIVFNILRLDPLRRHTTATTEYVSNLAALWNATAIAAQYQLPMVTNLFDLPASRLALDQQKDNSDDGYRNFRTDTEDGSYSEGQNNAMTPARAVMETRLVRIAAELITFSDNDGTISD